MRACHTEPRHVKCPDLPYNELIEYGLDQHTNKLGATLCWEWVGPINRGDYGTYKGFLAHRLSYEIRIGPIPPMMSLDHLCRNRSCINVFAVVHGIKAMLLWQERLYRMN